MDHLEDDTETGPLTKEDLVDNPHLPEDADKYDFGFMDEEKNEADDGDGDGEVMHNVGGKYRGVPFYISYPGYHFHCPAIGDMSYHYRGAASFASYKELELAIDAYLVRRQKAMKSAQLDVPAVAFENAWSLNNDTGKVIPMQITGVHAGHGNFTYRLLGQRYKSKSHSFSMRGTELYMDVPEVYELLELRVRMAKMENAVNSALKLFVFPVKPKGNSTDEVAETYANLDAYTKTRDETARTKHIFPLVGKLLRLLRGYAVGDAGTYTLAVEMSEKAWQLETIKRNIERKKKKGKA